MFTSEKDKFNQDVKFSKLNDACFFSYLTKNTTNSKPHLIARSLVRLEEGDAGEKFVRIYQVVYAPARDHRRKDITLNEEGTITINGKQNVWINMGNPFRALQFAQEYRRKGLEKKLELESKLNAGEEATYDNHTYTGLEEVNYYNGRPIIRSALIPVNIYKKITENAIDEDQRKSLGSYTLNSDQPRSPDQYALNKEDLELLRASIVPSSLLSYVVDDYIEAYESDKRNGEVLGISSLLEELGMPDDYLENPSVPIEQAEAKARKLTKLFDQSSCINSMNDKEKIAFKDALAEENITLSFPIADDELLELQDKLSKYASFAIMPVIMRDNYNEAVKKEKAVSKVFKGYTAADEAQVVVSKWTEEQDLQAVARDPFTLK